MLKSSILKFAEFLIENILEFFFVNKLSKIILKKKKSEIVLLTRFVKAKKKKKRNYNKFVIKLI